MVVVVLLEALGARPMCAPVLQALRILPVLVHGGVRARVGGVGEAVQQDQQVVGPHVDVDQVLGACLPRRGWRCGAGRGGVCVCVWRGSRADVDQVRVRRWWGV